MLRHVAAVAVALAAVATAVASDGAGPAAEPDDLRAAFADQLGPQEPVYFSLGLKERLNARFQLSFRYAFLSPEREPAGVWSRTVRHLAFGYTQTSVWDLESDSAPFFDTSYRPSVFWDRRRVASWRDGRSALDLQAGFEHESNGQGGDDSRSLNILYVMPTLRFATAGTWRFSVAPRIFGYVGDLSDNPDIADYRGHVDLQLAARQRDGVHLVAQLRKGTRSDRGSVQVDVTLPVRWLGLRGVGGFLHLQYFAGWGETLRTYDRKLPSEIRIGLAIVR